MAHDGEVDGEEIKKKGNCHAVNNILIFFGGVNSMKTTTTGTSAPIPKITPPWNYCSPQENCMPTVL